MNPSNVSVLLSVLAFLGTIALVGLLAVLALWWAARGDGRRARLAAMGALGAGIAYAAVLAVASLTSREQLIPAGGEKYFCELDCHLAYKVVAVAPALDQAGDSRLWAVTVQTRFDETTISERRPRDAPLTPSPRQIRLRAGTGSRVPALTPAEVAAAGIADTGTPIDQALRPAESYRTTVWFRLPAGESPTVLLLEDDVEVSRVLIGNERSPMHAKVVLALPGPAVVG